MALVPRYWYVEPFGGGEPLQLPPGRIITPRPLGSDGNPVVADAVTGEVYREAVLMWALPWPRFRGALGEQVLLPQWHAQALERCENELRSSNGEWRCPTCVSKRGDRPHHVRVEFVDIERAAISARFVCHCGFSS